MAATMGFVDPFRAANYLEGTTLFSWDFVSESGGECHSSNGAGIYTKSLADLPLREVDFLIVSSSWTPEKYGTTRVQAALRQAALRQITIGGIDTGAFVIAGAGLLRGGRATVHYEHIDAFCELYPDVECTEDLYVFDEGRISCCGGFASLILLCTYSRVSMATHLPMLRHVMFFIRRCGNMKHLKIRRILNRWEAMFQMRCEP